MAEGRMLKRRISMSKQIAELVHVVSGRLDPEHGAYAALVFTWLISHADREGRMHGDPDLVKQTVCPRLSRVTSEHVAEYLTGMAECGLIQWYAARDDKWVALPGFDRAQTGLRKDREAVSLCPAPSEGVQIAARTRSGPAPDGTPELLRSYSGADAGVTPQQAPQKGMEEKRSELNARASDWRHGLEERWIRLVGGGGFSAPGLSDLADRVERAAQAEARDPVVLFEQMTIAFLAWRETCSQKFKPGTTPNKLIEHWALIWERITRPITDDDPPAVDGEDASTRAAIDGLAAGVRY